MHAYHYQHGGVWLEGVHLAEPIARASKYQPWQWRSIKTWEPLRHHQVAAGGESSSEARVQRAHLVTGIAAVAENRTLS